MTAAFEPELVELIEWVIDTRLRNFQAPVLGTVTGFDKAARRVDVLPLVGSAQIDRISREVTWSAPSELRGVPLAAVGTARSKHFLDLQPGDRVLVMPLMHSLDELVDSDTTSPVTPRDPRQQSLLDSVAIPLSWSDAPDGHADFERTLGGRVAVGDPANAEALCTLAEFQAHIGKYNTFVGMFNSHTHVSHGVVTVPSASGDNPASYNGTSDLKAT